MTKHKSKDDLPRWDLTNVYPSLDSKEFKSANAELDKQLDNLDKYIKDQKIDQSGSSPAETDPTKLAKTIDGLITRMNEVRKLYQTLSAYVYAFVSTDSYNSEAIKIESKLDATGVRLQKQGVLVESWIGSIAKLIPEIIKKDGAGKDHAFFLEESAEQSQFLMSSGEESLAAELNLSGGNAWSKLQGIVTSQLKVDFELDGKSEEMPITALLNVKYHDDESVRRRAYETEFAAWDTLREPLAACLNGIKGSVNTLNKRRGRKDSLHSSIDGARIDRDTLEALLTAMKDSFPMFRKYFKAKAKRLGKDSLAWWDLWAPVGKKGRTFSYPEAQDFIIEQFGDFSPELASYAKHAFDNNWMDVSPRDGKRAGAFCMYIPGVKESRILLNFDGSLDEVFTIAHELGHGFHNEVAKEKTELQTITPMTLAETASIMCETIVTNAAIAQADDSDEELGILETSLIGDAQVVVDIYSRYLFEKEIFERRAEVELSADDFCEIMEDAQGETYGDALDKRYRHKYMWTWKPHYYSTGISYYNYPYAFGLLFGTGLYAIYQERGSDFVGDYKGLLASTGEASAADLAARFNIDIRKKEFWANSLKVIGKRIDRYIAI